MSDLVTGEAVVLGVQPARLPSRMLACALDLTALFALLIALTAGLAFAVPDLDSAAAAAVTLSLTVGILVGIPVAVETLSRGRSLGKLALGLRVVRTDGGPVRFRQALVRGLVGFFEIIALTGVPAVVCSLVSDRGRRLGDVLAGTLVVRERVPGAGAGRAPLPPLPPQAAGAAGGELSSLDLSAVPDALWLAVRQYLGRIRELDQQVAWNLGRRLSADVAVRTGRAVPGGVHPAAYLAAVLAERQHREWVRTAAAHRAAAAPAAPGVQTPASGAGPAAPAPGPWAGPGAAPQAPVPTPPIRSAAEPSDTGAGRSGGGTAGGGFAPPA
ncbi:RDD family protein [Streptacidiphilus sp. ASG 303]|uniref:RDD family protein n=1 Tax=Streptacidiphilus sp. ASG 303 TaxID=2896847 RepID=UPI001E5CF9E8|nr:RDD family protein [Streptacidiphilus sp. ASG 303]MCD0481763.1 RDD family protein [Streptacidiphilus sp. ASG 303]